MRVDAISRTGRLLLALCWVVVGAAALPADAERRVVKLGTIAPEGSIWHEALLQIREEWRELSGGDIELRIYAGGVLGDEVEMVRKLRRRGLDAIAISGSGLPAAEPSVDCLHLPLLFDSYAELDYVRERMAPELERRIEARGLRVLQWADAGWIYFFTKREVRTPDELRGLRLWMALGWPQVERLFKEFGFLVVPLPATDMLTGLQTGLVEAIDVPPLFAMLDGSYRIANHMIDIKWAPLIAATVIRNSVWEAFPAHLQAPLLEAFQRIGTQMRAQIRQAGDDAVREMQKRGLRVVELDPAERALWRAEARAAYPALRGQLADGELIDQVLRLHDAFKAQTREAPAVPSAAAPAR